jgi:GNAT superfamily N-acetyltransferase
VGRLSLGRDQHAASRHVADLGLMVAATHRRRGIGRALLGHLARRCVGEGLPRLEWWVLDWNEPSLAFYRSLGAVPMDGWTVQRLTGEALTTLAKNP